MKHSEMIFPPIQFVIGCSAYLSDRVDDMLITVVRRHDSTFIQLAKVLRDLTLHRLQRQPADDKQFCVQ